MITKGRQSSAANRGDGRLKGMRARACAGVIWLMASLPTAAFADLAPASSGLARVALPGFSIDATEVTVGRFGEWKSPADRATKAEQDGGGVEYAAGWEQRPGWVWHAPYGQPAGPTEPAVHLTWHEAHDYCQSVGGRLPSADEWRRAAYVEMRSEPTDGYEHGRRYRYPVGDQPEGMNTSAADPWPRHAPAGATRRGVNGLYDMGANVWEWLADTDADRALTAGGSWWYGPEQTVSENLQYKPKAFAGVYIGFRCVYPAG